MSGRALFCGAWDEGPGYPRTRSLRQGLEVAGIEVHECRVHGLGRDKQRLLRQPWRWPGTWWQQTRQRRQLLGSLRRSCAELRPDFVLVPYPGHRVASAIRDQVEVPMVLDLFLSAYDTVCEDRQLVRPGSLLARWLQRLDTEACAAADLVLLDTPENAAYVQALTGLPPERFGWLPVHDPDACERPPAGRPPANGSLQLLFFGTGVPLHGLATLVEAVLMAPGVHLTLVGGSPADRRRAQELLAGRLTLEPEFVDRQRLRTLLAQCDLVAGVFGDDGGRSSKVQRVVPFKVVHALAAARPVITADTPAIARWLDGSGAVLPTPVGNAVALAEHLRQLVAEPARLAAAAAVARAAYDRHFGTAQLADRWRQLLQRLGVVQLAEVA